LELVTFFSHIRAQGHWFGQYSRFRKGWIKRWKEIIFSVHIIIKYFVIYSVLMSEENKKKFDCRCGAAFDTVEELDKHNHEAH